MPRYQKIIRHVEEEEGQPFWEVVRDYAEMGCSRTETSRLLGFEWPDYFLRLLRDHPEKNIHWVKPSQCVLTRDMHERCRIAGSDDHQRLCRANKAAMAKIARRYWLDSIYDTLSGHLERLGTDVALRTVRNRMKRGWSLERALKEPRMSAYLVGKRNAAKRRQAA